MTTALILFWWMLVAHAVCDYPLQGDFLAKGKNHTAPILGVPWWICLVAHSLIHGGAVALVLYPRLRNNAVLFGVTEALFHAKIDYAKCSGLTTFTTDQICHVFCKSIFAIGAAAM